MNPVLNSFDVKRPCIFFRWALLYLALSSVLAFPYRPDCTTCGCATVSRTSQLRWFLCANSNFLTLLTTNWFSGHKSKPSIEQIKSWSMSYLSVQFSCLHTGFPVYSAALFHRNPAGFSLSLFLSVAALYGLVNLLVIFLSGDRDYIPNACHSLHKAVLRFFIGSLCLLSFWNHGFPPQTVDEQLFFLLRIF